MSPSPSIGLSDGKTVHGPGGEGLSRLEAPKREVRVVHRIRVELGLQAEGRVRLHGQAVLAGQALHGVKGVKLHPGKIGKDLHHPPALRLVGLGKFPEALAVYAEIVVEPAAELDHMVGGEHVLAQGLPLGEIQGAAGHLGKGAVGDQVVGHMGDLLRVDGQHRIQHFLLRVAGQVEEGMVGGIEGRFLVGNGIVAELQSAVRLQGVGHGELDLPRVALVAVGAYMSKGNGGLAVRHRRPDAPQGLVIAAGAAMEGVVPIVLGKLVGLAAQGELRAADPVGVTAHEGPLVVGAEIFLQRAVAQYHIPRHAVFILDQKLDDPAAIIGGYQGHFIVFQRAELSLPSVGKPAKSSNASKHGLRLLA